MARETASVELSKKKKKKKEAPPVPEVEPSRSLIAPFLLRISAWKTIRIN